LDAVAFGIELGFEVSGNLVQRLKQRDCRVRFDTLHGMSVERKGGQALVVRHRVPPNNQVQMRIHVMETKLATFCGELLGELEGRTVNKYDAPLVNSTLRLASTSRWINEETMTPANSRNLRSSAARYAPVFIV